VRSGSAQAIVGAEPPQQDLLPLKPAACGVQSSRSGLVTASSEIA
jgi:hypothetical protein